MMNEDSRQSLSVLLDGECSGPEMQRAIDQLLADGEMQQRWERFHLASHVLRGEHADLSGRLAGRRILDSLAGLDPVQPGGARTSWSSSGPGSARAKMPARPRSRRWRQYVPLTSALAAALAMVAIFVVPGEFDTTDAGIVDAGNIPSVATTAQRWQRDDPFLRAKLDELLVSHHELTPGSGLSGFVSYADFVGYEDRP